jgi:hypothetical protein
MSRLSDLVNEAVILNTKADGTISAHDAVAAITPDLDDESREALIVEALTARVMAAAKSSKSSILKMAERRNMELPFEGLHGAYPLDIEGRYIKRTESLSRAEMQRVINIREKSINDDMKSLSGLRAGFVAAEPHWEAHPGWTFGQCCSAILKAEPAKSSAAA